MKCLLPYFDMVTVSYKMVGLERMLDYGGVGLQGFQCIVIYMQISFCAQLYAF